MKDFQTPHRHASDQLRQLSLCWPQSRLTACAAATGRLRLEQQSLHTVWKPSCEQSWPPSAVSRRDFGPTRPRRPSKPMPRCSSILQETLYIRAAAKRTEAKGSAGLQFLLASVHCRSLLLLYFDSFPRRQSSAADAHIHIRMARANHRGRALIECKCVLLASDLVRVGVSGHQYQSARVFCVLNTSHGRHVGALLR